MLANAVRKRTESLGATALGDESGRGVEVFDVDVAGERLVVLSVPLDVALPSCLSNAEREVARGALHGLTNAEIARRRGCAERTIANQMASILRKLGVSSRGELVMLLFRGDAAEES